METPYSLKLDVLKRQKSNEVKFLNNSKKNKKIPSSLATASQEHLLNLAKKQRSDKVKFTHFFLKNRLSSELDATIANHIKEHPEMKDDFFIGILNGSPFYSEVVDLKTASESVIDASKEEALEVLKQQNIGYFDKEDFSLKTRRHPAYQKLKERIDSFFEDNLSIFQYLKERPEYNVSAEDFYSQPKK